MEQLLCHLVGDYVLQNTWMAWNKGKQWLPAIVHASIYTAVFLCVTTSLPALAAIGGTHLLLDRFQLPKYWYNIVRSKEKEQPQSTFGFQVGIYIVIDNTFHLIINYLALEYLS